MVRRDLILLVLFEVLKDFGAWCQGRSVLNLVSGWRRWWWQIGLGEVGEVVLGHVIPVLFRNLVIWSGAFH